MKTNELIRKLLAAGCQLCRHGGNHDMWYSPITGNYFTVGRHGAKEVPDGTARKIAKDSGVEF